MAEPAHTPPTVYLLHGEDDLAITEFIDHLRGRLGDPATAALNTLVLEGATLDLGELAGAATSLPFLSPRRLIILHGPMAYLGKDGVRRTRFLALLENLPDSTALVLVEPTPLPGTSPLLKWAEARPQACYSRRFDPPQGEAFARWLAERAHHLGGEIDSRAAYHLAELVANDPRLADQELAKLLDYVDRQRPIELADVERLTPFGGQSNVFAMVDAVGLQDGKQALAHLHRLLEDEPALYALAMIARQFRLLVLAREAIDSGLDPRNTLGVHPYVAGKIAAQARRFSLPQLESIHRRLLEVDVAIKTGQAEDSIALDGLIAELTA
jgi:DNA polymerase-3 subunit delta